MDFWARLFWKGPTAIPCIVRTFFCLKVSLEKGLQLIFPAKPSSWRRNCCVTYERREGLSEVIRTAIERWKMECLHRTHSLFFLSSELRWSSVDFPTGYGQGEDWWLNAKPEWHTTRRAQWPSKKRKHFKIENIKPRAWVVAKLDEANNQYALCKQTADCDFGKTLWSSSAQVKAKI